MFPRHSLTPIHHTLRPGTRRSNPSLTLRLPTSRTRRRGTHTSSPGRRSLPGRGTTGTRRQRCARVWATVRFNILDAAGRFRATSAPPPSPTAAAAAITPAPPVATPRVPTDAAIPAAPFTRAGTTGTAVPGAFVLGGGVLGGGWVGPWGVGAGSSMPGPFHSESVECGFVATSTGREC